MNCLKAVAQSIQALVQEHAAEVGQATRVVRRQRKFTPETLASTFVLGFLQHPRASVEQLAQMAAAVGVSVTPQAVDQRYTPELAAFLHRLFLKAVHERVDASQSLAPVLERFTDVEILDSTHVTLPDEMASDYPGCGGHNGVAALKVQTVLSLKRGAVKTVRLEPGRHSDRQTSLQEEPPPRRALRIVDLGYFDTEMFERVGAAGAYWLSPLAVGVNVYDASGQELDLPRWLPQREGLVDVPILLGKRRVKARLVAWRLPRNVVRRRRTRARKTARRKGRKVSAACLARCTWATLVTNVPPELLSAEEIRVLYRARWQIELLFKRWKSQGGVDELTASSPLRCQVQLWSRLLAAVLQQWLQAPLWGQPTLSLKKAWDTIRSFALPLAKVLRRANELRLVLRMLIDITRATARQNKRKKPSTFELLNHPSRLSFTLT